MGGEALRELRRINSDVRVVLASGYHERELVERFTGQGVWAFHYKSTALDKVIARLQEAL